MANQLRFWALFLIWLAVASDLWAQELYLGMPEQEIYFEMKGYPTSTAESQERKFLIYPGGIRLILERGKLLSAEGIEVLEEKPVPEEVEAETESISEVEKIPKPEAKQNPTPRPEEVPQPKNVPAFPSEDLDEPLPEELIISEDENARLKALTQASTERDSGEAVGGEETDSENFDFHEEPAAGTSRGVVFLVEFFIGMVVTLIILKIAVSLVGVTAFLPGLIAIALIDTLVRLGVGALFLTLQFPLGGPVQILVSFLVLLYLVKGFTSAREWPTIIQVVVTTKVVGFVAFWLLAMFVLNL